MYFDNKPQGSFTAHKKGSVGYLWIIFPAILSGRSPHISNLTGISFGSTETINFYDHVWVEKIKVNCIFKINAWYRWSLQNDTVP